MKTFSRDQSLPPLPVPELTATCAAILELAAPLVDAAGLERLHDELENFCSPGGTGDILQTCLHEQAAALPGNASWLRPLWDDMYLVWREALPVNMNYFFRFEAERWGGPAALPRLVRALTWVFRQLALEELEPEQTRGGPLAMDQAASCLYTRVPGRQKDSLAFVRATRTAVAAVVCRGHWFTLPLYGEDGNPLGEAALNRAFEAIRKQAGEAPPVPPVAALTSVPRAEAARLRAALQDTLQNRLSLAALERALFTISLDPAYEGDDDAARAFLCGDAASRWFDKSLQLIASDNGFLGANFEHAGCDAAIWVYLLGLADACLAARESPAVGNGAAEGNSAHIHSPLVWDVPAALAAELETARRDFARISQNLDVACRNFAAFSREGLKALGTSPDAFLQASFQVAQHGIFGRLRSSYEAISVRAFAEGRTECARGSSGEALALALALQKGSPPEKLHELYRQAERIHKSRVQRCQRALGVERHMSGLAAMWRLHGKKLGLGREPAVFTNSAWQTLKYDALSTSGIGAPFIRFFGFGPVVADGFGVGYAPGQEGTGLVVTCRKDSGWSAGQFLSGFAQAGESLASVLLRYKKSI